MPYIVAKNGPDDKPYCVYHKNEAGEPMGKTLGCHPSKEAANKQIAAVWANENKSVSLCRLPGGDVAVYKKDDGTWRLEVLGAPYGGHLGGKDAQGEFFSGQTDFVLGEGDKRPVFYYHGDDPQGQREGRPEVIGTAQAARRDERGLWFDVLLNKASKYATRIWDAALQGIARASTGAIGHLVRRAPSGELLVWPVGELSLLDAREGRMPANELAVVNLKAAFDLVELEMPKAFVEADEVKTGAAQSEETSLEDQSAKYAAIATVIYEAANKEK